MQDLEHGNGGIASQTDHRRAPAQDVDRMTASSGTVPTLNEVSALPVLFDPGESELRNQTHEGVARDVLARNMQLKNATQPEAGTKSVARTTGWYEGVDLVLTESAARIKL